MSAITPSHAVFTDEIHLGTGGELDIVDLTEEIRLSVRKSGVQRGTAHLFVAGQTAALTTLEYEPGAVSDLRGAIGRMAPEGIHYDHDERWGDGNGRSHVRASILGPDITVPVRGGEPLLGTWQQIILVELDLRGRNRTVHVTVLGTSEKREGPE